MLNQTHAASPKQLSSMELYGNTWIDIKRSTLNLYQKNGVGDAARRR
jgi:hypothetical protein